MSRYLKKTSLPLTLTALLVAALFTLRGEAQQPKNATTTVASGQKDNPIVGTAVAFAESDADRDMPDVEASMLNDFNEAENVERNPDNVSLAAWISTHGPSEAVRNLIPSFDAVLNGNSNAKGKLSAPSPNLPGAPLVTFDGMTAQEGYANFGGSTVAPSDENIAVGPKDVVQTTNTGFRIWDKAGNPRTNSKLIKSLFAKLGGVCGTFERGDPIAQYDRLSGRFVISQFDFANATAAPFYQCFAVSKTSDPTGSYYTYAFQTVTETPPGTPGVGTGQNFPDYPHIGSWPDGYYMTVNQFDRSKPAGTQFNGTGFYSFNRAKMLIGDPTANFVYFNKNLASNPEGIASVQPADIDGFTLPAAGQPCPFAYELSDEYESPPFNVDAIRMFNFHADFTTPASATFTERAESPVALAPYDPRMPEFESGTRAECQQPPPAANPAGTPPAAQGDSLNAISYHLMYRLQYRRSGNNENLTSAFMVNVSGIQPRIATEYQAAFRYVQLRKTSAAGTYSVFDQATFAPDPVDPANGTDRFLPSAAIDNQE